MSLIESSKAEELELVVDYTDNSALLTQGLHPAFAQGNENGYEQTTNEFAAGTETQHANSNQAQTSSIVSDDGDPDPLVSPNLVRDPNYNTQSPLVIDLGPTGLEKEEDGLVFFDRFSSPIFFDYDGNDGGFRERTAWVGPNEGIVVWDKDGDLDRNRDGVIDLGDVDQNEDGIIDADERDTYTGKIATNELVLTKGKAPGKTDLDALIQGLDKNGNGIIEDWETDGFADDGNGNRLSLAEGGIEDKGVLYIWRDSELNGKLDKGELVTFGSLVEKIDGNVDYLDKSKLADTDNDGDLDAVPEVRFRDGSMIYGTAKVTLVGGATTTAYDMGFAHNELGIRQDGDGYFTFEDGKREKDCGPGDNTFDVKADRPADDHARAWSITGGEGDDVLHGGEADDMISGDEGADRLFGERGDDLIVMDSDDLVVNGGLGYDVVMVEGEGGVTLNLTAAAVEAFYGGKGNDTATAGGSLGVYANGRPTPSGRSRKQLKPISRCKSSWHRGKRNVTFGVATPM
jgi:hypothetical protein